MHSTVFFSSFLSVNIPFAGFRDQNFLFSWYCFFMICWIMWRKDLNLVHFLRWWPTLNTDTPLDKVKEYRFCKTLFPFSALQWFKIWKHVFYFILSITSLWLIAESIAWTLQDKQTKVHLIGFKISTTSNCIVIYVCKDAWKLLFSDCYISLYIENSAPINALCSYPLLTSSQASKLR